MLEVLARLKAALANRYAIGRELGHGGMATVYLAQDLKHGRAVAIKVLRPELAAALGAERFLREIEIAARLSNPHILPLHDSGEAAGFLYYVMPFVEGESLRDRLNRERQLPVEEAVRIAREVATALSHAHGHNLVHRDIKPENILLSGGEAVVADFGIARAIVAAGADQLTDTGLAVGTPGYMSPEQAMAQQHIDGRADIYALGCVLYEMLAGHPPFLGTTAQEILARHTLDPVPPLRTIRRELPEAIEHAVRKALAKAPADRWRSPAAFGEALGRAVAPPSVTRRAARSLGLVAAGASLLAAGYALLSRPRIANSSGEAAPSIAVLPFVNIGADPASEPFSDGMSEELMTALARIEGLRVTARTSAFRFKGKAVDVREIGSKLNVGYVLEGSVRRAGPQLRVSAQLINAATGYHLWSDEYDRDARDVFAVQDEIARAIVGAMRVKLSGAANATLVKPSTENPEAHDLYLQGRYFFAKRDSTSLRKAQDYFERAIVKDPSYALAYAGLSDAYSHRAVFGYVPPHDIHSKAKQAVLRALALDSTLAEAHTSLGFIDLFLEWDWTTAGREFDRALALDSRYPPAHLFRAWYFVATDRMEDAIGEVQTAVSLDPFSLVNNARLSSMLYYARRYNEALAQARRLLELDSMSFQVRVELARAYLQLGQCDEALAAMKHAPEQASGAAYFRGVWGWINARCGHPAQALAELNRFRAEVREGRYVSHYSLAIIHAALGDSERAFAQLDSAYVEGTWAMFTLRVEPAFEAMRADPRFARLLQKVGLEP